MSNLLYLMDTIGINNNFNRFQILIQEEKLSLDLIKFLVNIYL